MFVYLMVMKVGCLFQVWKEFNRISFLVWI